jgi:FkbH-like protein
MAARAEDFGMNACLFSDLSWLPRPPDDFRRQVRALPDQSGPLGRPFRNLASYALDQNQLNSLAKAMAAARGAGRSLAPLVPFRLGLIGNGTLDFIVPALIVSAARHGFLLDCVSAHYDQVIQEAVAPDSKLNRAELDAVLIALDYRGMPLQFKPGDVALSEASVARAMQYIDTIRSGIRHNGKTISIVQTLARPIETIFGSLDRVTPGTPQYVIQQINDRLAEQVAASDDLLLDVAGFAETVGLAAWHDPTLWNLAKIPFSGTFLPLYADHVARLIAAHRGKSRRCLVLDLDNTLWGGVIGDDGLEGIVLAQGDATGEAHLSVQRMALSLRERGIVLAVSSKNDDAVARRAFREHPEMLIQEGHIAVFQANWNDKATNIKAIADELVLGLESLVFLDDNPVERGLVRQMLPEVAVPELPDDPALYARTLAAAGYFDSIAFSDEDKKRADFYQANARRVSLQKQAGDIADYLASLNMEITFQPFEAVGRARISQLINKSNQFNLTTRRYTEAEVAAAERDPDCLTLQVRLIDAFGDNGMISVIICREGPRKAWTIDTWLMSCRVLGRGVERMVLREILRHAGRCGVAALVGVYRPTERNGMVRDHYRGLGFSQIATQADGETVWSLAVDTQIEGAPMQVRRVGFEVDANA